MEKDILALLANENGGFSKGQRRIAQYIVDNYDKAAFMTAGRLGDTVGVSESTDTLAPYLCAAHRGSAPDAQHRQCDPLGNKRGRGDA